MLAPRPRLLLCLLLLIAAGVFLTGIHWGLPSQRVNRYLFADREPWTGLQVKLLADLGSPNAWDDPNRGADVDANPQQRSLKLSAELEQQLLDAQLEPTTLPATQPTSDSATTAPSTAPADPAIRNADNPSRAEIVRRYRLFSYQPDEMITLMSLAKMKPAEFDFDPRLYQYGGLWIYPVGLLLKVASVVGYVELKGGTGGLTYYLDNPEAFGRFYVVARVYTVMWGLIAAAAVFSLVRKITASAWAAFGAGLLFVLMPVVVNAAHEAKPHLPGVALTLLAVLAAAQYVETGRLSHAIAAGVLCGFSLGMILSALPVFIILPLMVLLRKMSWGDRLRVASFAILIGFVAYAVTNPYVAIHLLRGGGALQSNLGNSSAFYYVHEPIEGLINVVRLIIVGTSPALATAGVLGTIFLGVRAFRTRQDNSPAAIRRRAHGLLLAGPALFTAIQWALVGAGKPGEFGRFLLITDIFLAVEAVVLLQTYVFYARTAVLLFGILLLQTGARGATYVIGFVRDTGSMTSRLQAADAIEKAKQGGAKRVLVSAEPAPYSVPPMDLFGLEVVLVPKEAKASDLARPGDVVVEVLEGRTPIGWADKKMTVRVVEKQ